MKKTDVIAVPYALVRVPLSYLDAKFFRRLPEHAELRIAFDQALGGIDLLAGNVLGIDSISLNGLARLQHAGARGRMLRLSEKDAVDPLPPKVYAITRPSRH